MSTFKLGAQIEGGRAPALVRSKQIIDDFLHDAVASGRFGPGARLPTERALSEQLRVPRSAVRNVFSRWEALGRLIRITGSGTYVADAGAATEAPFARLPRPPESSPLEIMATRLLIEPRLAALAVVHATQSELDQLQHCLDRGEAAADFEAFEQYDTQLHEAIAAASHNRLLIGIYGMITAARDQIEWGEMKRRSHTPQGRKTLEAQHRDIVAALRLRDAGKAETAAAEHLRTVHQSLIGRLD